MQNGSLPKVLVSIFHRSGANDNNFERLKAQLSRFDIYIPTIEYYGRKWSDTRNYFLAGNYHALFIICSDVSIITGDITTKLLEYAADDTVGCYGFGTLKNSTFPWLKYNNIPVEREVPFIEGYCIGINRSISEYLTVDNVYGYGIDVQIGYECHAKKLRCLVNNEVCISHEYGKSYDDQNATNEYKRFLLSHPHVHNYLRTLGIYTPI